MTENEAKTTRCCGPGDCGVMQLGMMNRRVCAASDCMAWRWEQGEGERVYRQRNATNQEPARGYCGLAG